MTREEARKAAEVMLAYANGEEIETLCFGEYIPCEDPSFNWVDGKSIKNYRIKPKSRYRPFETQEECWNEMHKHPDFGWVKSKVKGYFHLIGLVQWSSEFEDVIITFATSEQLARSSRSLFEDFTFADGAPFGIMEE